MKVKCQEGDSRNGKCRRGTGARRTREHVVAAGVQGEAGYAASGA